MTSTFENIKRVLTALEKGLGRLLRSKYHNPTQHPEIINIIQETIDNIQLWLENRKILLNQSLGAYLMIFALFGELESLIDQFWDILKPAKGVRLLGKKQRIRQQERLANSIDSALEKISKALNDLKMNDSQIREALEMALEKSFDNEILRPFQRKVKIHIAERGKKHTYSHGARRENTTSLLTTLWNFKLTSNPTFQRGKTPLAINRTVKDARSMF
jgi:hypothetical protein